MVGGGRWLAGWLATWAILAGMAETRALEPLASTLAAVIAIGAFLVVGPRFLEIVRRSV